MPGRAFPVAKKITVCQEGLYTKEDSVTIKENLICRQKCRLKIQGELVGEWKTAGYIKMVGKKMYRVSKVLNNNGIIAINMEENQEYVLLGKGVGFGKKVSQRFEAPADCTIYRLAQETERGSAKELAKSVAGISGDCR